MSSSSGLASNPTCRVSCRSRSLILVYKISISLFGLLETRTVGYYADQEPRFVYDTGLDAVTRHQALPDVSVMENPRPVPVSHGAVAIAPAPLELLITSDLP